MKSDSSQTWKKFNELLNENITEFHDIKSVSYLPHDQENVKIVFTNKNDKVSTTLASFYADPRSKDRIEYLTKNIPSSSESQQFKNLVQHLKDILIEINSDEYWKEQKIL